MFGASLVERSPAELERDFLGRPWLDGPDEWLSPLARDEEDEVEDDEEDDDEEEEDEDFDDEDFDDEDFDDDFDDDDLDDLDDEG